jgi:hypothetical protein
VGDRKLDATDSAGDSGAGAAVTSAAKDTIVANQLFRRVRIRGADQHVLTLAPLERRLVRKDEELSWFDLDRIQSRGAVTVTRKPDTNPASVIVGGGFWLVVGYFIVGSNLDHLWFWVGGALFIIVASMVAMAFLRRGGLEVLRWTKQTAAFLLVVGLAYVIPAAAIFWSTNLHAVAFGPRPWAELDASSAALVGRVIQLVFIASAALLPGLMYFVFDREQLGTLRDRFVQQVFRLDPTLQSMQDLDAKFGPQIEEVFGSQQSSRTAKLLGGRLAPIVAATTLITLGWTVTLLNSQVAVGPGQSFRILDLFAPEKSAVTFAFLGAYFFAIQLVARSYLRGDLRPKSYGSIAVRILIVVILAWVLEEIAGGDPTGLLAAVFVAGIVPETAVQWIVEFVKRVPWSSGASADVVERHPLTQLEGIDLYDRTRLMDEGVSNVEALAHHDLIDLMLRTRIPAPRLVDWVDQAILFLHLQDAEEPVEHRLQNRLRSYGIRTATDLERACAAAQVKGSQYLTKLLAKLGGEPEAAEPYRIEVVLETMRDDEWLTAIRHWREPVDFSKHVLFIDAPRRPVATGEIVQGALALEGNGSVVKGGKPDALPESTEKEAG